MILCLLTLGRHVNAVMEIHPEKDCVFARAALGSGEQSVLMYRRLTDWCCFPLIRETTYIM